MSTLKVTNLNSATSGKTTVVEWDDSVVDVVIDYDRTLYNRVQLKGWCDVPAGSSTDGIFFQPTIGGVGQVLSTMNGGGSFVTWLDPALAASPANQIYWNSVASGIVRWHIDLELLNTQVNTWHSSLSGAGFQYSTSHGSVYRFLTAQNWDNTSGNDLDGWRVASNRSASGNKGYMYVTYSKLTSYG